MTYSASDMQSGVDANLRQLGYHVIGSDEDGWGVVFGASDDAKPFIEGLDSAAEASALAVQDLVGQAGSLLAAADAVVKGWDSGDLAGLVQELAQAVKVLDPVVQRTVTEDQAKAWNVDQLRRLRRSGLSFDDCVAVFGVHARESTLARRAQDRFNEEGVVEVADPTVVSESEAGAYVMAWVHVEK